LNETLLIEFVIFFISGIFHGLLGFGFPMLATPMISLFESMKNSILMVISPTMVLNFKSIQRDNSFISVFKEYWLLVSFVILGSFLSTTILIHFNSRYYRLILACLIMLYLFKNYLRLNLTTHFLKYDKTYKILFGFASGMASGLTNIMIPVLVIYILELKLSKNRAIGVMNFCFLSSKIMQFMIFGISGEFTPYLVYISFYIVFISFAGLLLGEKLRGKIDEKIYTFILKGTLFLLAVYLTFSVYM